MTRKIILKTLFVLFFGVPTFAQVEKNTWIIGGSLSYEHSRSSGTELINNKTNVYDINGTLGYFPIDKLAAGLRLTGNHDRTEYTDPSSSIHKTRSTQFGVGPFVRYYLLPIDKQVNVLTEDAFTYVFFSNRILGDPASEDKRLRYSLATGPVVFLNSSIGLEFLLSYTNEKFISVDSKRSIVGFRVGLQFYLQRDE